MRKQKKRINMKKNSVRDNSIYRSVIDLYPNLQQKSFSDGGGMYALYHLGNEVFDHQIELFELQPVEQHVTFCASPHVIEGKDSLYHYTLVLRHSKNNKDYKIHVFFNEKEELIIQSGLKCSDGDYYTVSKRTKNAIIDHCCSFVSPLIEKVRNHQKDKIKLHQSIDNECNKICEELNEEIYRDQSKMELYNKTLNERIDNLGLLNSFLRVPKTGILELLRMMKLAFEEPIETFCQQAKEQFSIKSASSIKPKTKKKKKKKKKPKPELRKQNSSDVGAHHDIEKMMRTITGKIKSYTLCASRKMREEKFNLLGKLAEHCFELRGMLISASDPTCVQKALMHEQKVWQILNQHFTSFDCLLATPDELELIHEYREFITVSQETLFHAIEADRGDILKILLPLYDFADSVSGRCTNSYYKFTFKMPQGQNESRTLFEWCVVLRKYNALDVVLQRLTEPLTSYLAQHSPILSMVLSSEDDPDLGLMQLIHRYQNLNQTKKFYDQALQLKMQEATDEEKNVIPLMFALLEKNFELKKLVKSKSSVLESMKHKLSGTIIGQQAGRFSRRVKKIMESNPDILKSKIVKTDALIAYYKKLNPQDLWQNGLPDNEESDESLVFYMMINNSPDNKVIDFILKDLRYTIERIRRDTEKADAKNKKEENRIDNIYVSHIEAYRAGIHAQIQEFVHGLCCFFQNLSPEKKEALIKNAPCLRDLGTVGVEKITALIAALDSHQKEMISSKGFEGMAVSGGNSAHSIFNSTLNQPPGVGRGCEIVHTVRFTEEEMIRIFGHKDNFPSGASVYRT